GEEASGEGRRAHDRGPEVEAGSARPVAGSASALAAHRGRCRGQYGGICPRSPGEAHRGGGEAEGIQAVIYFAQLPTGAVKIGYTGIDLETRMAQLEYEFGVPFALIHAVPGDREDESEWHSRFDHLRLPGNGEQFRPGPDLMAAIGRPLLVSSNPDAIETV